MENSLSDCNAIGMTRLRNALCAVALGLCAMPAMAAPAKGDARCEVWARELAFARSVAEHDAKAFAELLHANAAFGVTRGPTTGRENIVREWQGIIDGSALKLEWYPDLVTVGGDGSVVFSSGPALYQDPKTGAYRHGRFGSVWQRDTDGAWRVVFDDGLKPEPADEAQVKAFRDGSGRACVAA